jgi:hypothetical protein
LVGCDVEFFREVGHHLKKEELKEVVQDLILILPGETIEAKVLD